MTEPKELPTKFDPVGGIEDRDNDPGVASVLSVDVEDWFHILDLPSAPPMVEWRSLPSRVEANFMALLDLFEAQQVKSTCFFLGWVAERFPHLVTEAANRGHEIASHGYAHRLTYQCSAMEFKNDIQKAKDVLEQISGCAVIGYRSPGFSCTKEVPWFFEMLLETGHRYDSSIFPARRGHGGIDQAQLAPHVVTLPGGSLTEFPITVIEFLGRRLCMFGGGYLRLFPYFLVKPMARRVLKQNRPVIFYVHPREIDRQHPRLPMSWSRRFKCYVNLPSTESKLRAIIRDFKLTTFQILLDQN